MVIKIEYLIVNVIRMFTLLRCTFSALSALFHKVNYLIRILQKEIPEGGIEEHKKIQRIQ